MSATCGSLAGYFPGEGAKVSGEIQSAAPRVGRAQRDYEKAGCYTRNSAGLTMAADLLVTQRTTTADPFLEGTTSCENSFQRAS